MIEAVPKDRYSRYSSQNEVMYKLFQVLILITSIKVSKSGFLIFFVYAHCKPWRTRLFSLVDRVSDNEARVPWLILDRAQMFQCVCFSSFCVFNAELFHTSRMEL